MLRMERETAADRDRTPVEPVETKHPQPTG